MENIKIDYLTVRDMFDRDEQEIRKFMNSIVNKEIKAKLCDEERQYYAEAFGCKKEEVFVGDITKQNCPEPFPYKYVVGNVDVTGLCVDMSKLRYVGGNLNSNKVHHFNNLEVVCGTANFDHSKGLVIPKLRKVSNLSAMDCFIVDLKVKEIPGKLILSQSTVLNFGVRNVAGWTSLYCSNIEDISSLVSCHSLDVTDTAGRIKKVNPNLTIKDKLYAERSGNFEDKLDLSKKKGWWYTDNPKII